MVCGAQRGVAMLPLTSAGCQKVGFGRVWLGFELPPRQPTPRISVVWPHNVAVLLNHVLLNQSNVAWFDV